MTYHKPESHSLDLQALIGLAHPGQLHVSARNLIIATVRRIFGVGQMTKHLFLLTADLISHPESQELQQLQQLLSSDRLRNLVRADKSPNNCTHMSNYT